MSRSHAHAARSSTACRGIRYGSVAFDEPGSIYVADAGNQRIQKFSGR